ncbi:MAG: PspC domain-containing protein [Mucinivorans sp.]
MNKTINVNIGGRPFIVDEDAHIVLRSYLSQIVSRLMPAERDEVMDDVESRIADIFNSFLSSRTQVVTLGAVHRAIAIIGSADAFGEQPTQPVQPSTPPSEPAPIKELTRSRRWRILGGVCGGIAEHFDCDVVLVRLLAVLALMMGSFGFWVYIIMWIVVPESKKIER